jgi:hypothetical protein
MLRLSTQRDVVQGAAVPTEASGRRREVSSSTRMPQLRSVSTGVSRFGLVIHGGGVVGPVASGDRSRLRVVDAAETLALACDARPRGRVARRLGCCASFCEHEHGRAGKGGRHPAVEPVLGRRLRRLGARYTPWSWAMEYATCANGVDGSSPSEGFEEGLDSRRRERARRTASLRSRAAVTQARARRTGSWPLGDAYADSPNGLPSESLQIAQRSPGCTTSPPSSTTRSRAEDMSATRK